MIHRSINQSIHEHVHLHEIQIRVRQKSSGRQALWRIGGPLAERGNLCTVSKDGCVASRTKTSQHTTSSNTIAGQETRGGIVITHQESSVGLSKWNGETSMCEGGSKVGGAHRILIKGWYVTIRSLLTVCRGNARTKRGHSLDLMDTRIRSQSTILQRKPKLIGV